MVDDDVDNNPENYDKLHANYDLTDEGVFDNDNADVGESYVYTTLTNLWLFPKNYYIDDDILLRPGVFDVEDKPSIDPNFFNSTLSEILSWLYINADPISNTQVFHHALLKASKRKKKGNINNSIKHYDALWCKF